MDAKIRRQAISEEWMIDPHHPLETLSRLKYRATYPDVTLWWLVVQLDLIDTPKAKSPMNKLNLDL